LRGEDAPALREIDAASIACPAGPVVGFPKLYAGSDADLIKEYKEDGSFATLRPVIAFRIASQLLWDDSDDSDLEALKVLDYLTSQFPGFASAHFLHGRALARLGESRRALVAFDKARSISPSLGWLIESARAAYDLGEASLVDDIIHREVESKICVPAGAISVSALYAARNGAPTRALSLASRALATPALFRDGSSILGRALAARGRARFLLGDPEGGAHDLQRSIEFRDDHEFRLWLGESRLACGDRTAAQSDLTSVALRSPLDTLREKAMGYLRKCDSCGGSGGLETVAICTSCSGSGTTGIGLDGTGLGAIRNPCLRCSSGRTREWTPCSTCAGAQYVLR
jgi:tetratricopeptide (TPR) repeat protein